MSFESCSDSNLSGKITRSLAAALLVAASFVCQLSVARQMEVEMDLGAGESSASGVQSADASGNATWTFSASDPVFTFVPLDDLLIPIRVHTSEYVLTDPKKGVFKFRDGKVASVTRTPLDVIATPNLYNRSVRPTLFVSIPGANGSNTDGHGVQNWQHQLDFRFSTFINQSQYVHFTVDWESNLHMQSQVGDLADLVKAFLNSKAFPWDVVLIGHSRGGVFAHELGMRLAGHKKISKLHMMLLDPTAATSFGDTYPTSKPANAYGYLKYDLYPFTIAGALGTRGDENITGYDNYGLSDFYNRYTGQADSHGNYPYDWIGDAGTHGFANALQRVMDAKDNAGGSFPVDGASGKDLVQVRTRMIDADLDAQCSSTSCVADGQVAFGPLGTVSLTGMVGSDGVDAAVASTVAGASVVIRQDQIYATQTTLFSQHTARVDQSGITVYATITNGLTTVHAELGQTSADVVVSIGSINVPLISISPLDALIPGASLFKKKWKIFKGLF